MRRREFQQLVESLSTLSPHQLRQLNESVGELAQQNEVRTLVAEHVQREGQRPHCDAKKLQRWGTTVAGEQRYRCASCRKSFTGLTGTALNRVRHKGLLLDYAACMKEGLSVREAADPSWAASQRRLQVAPSPDVAACQAPTPGVAGRSRDRRSLLPRVVQGPQAGYAAQGAQTRHAGG